jgi:hypothetical protein
MKKAILLGISVVLLAGMFVAYKYLPTNNNTKKIRTPAAWAWIKDYAIKLKNDDLASHGLKEDGIHYINTLLIIPPTEDRKTVIIGYNKAKGLIIIGIGSYYGDYGLEAKIESYNENTGQFMIKHLNNGIGGFIGEWNPNELKASKTSIVPWDAGVKHGEKFIEELKSLNNQLQPVD